jgi:hypothetical protein
VTDKVNGSNISSTSNLAPFDELPDEAFDVFVPSVHDCVISDDDNCTPEMCVDDDNCAPEMCVDDDNCAPEMCIDDDNCGPEMCVDGTSRWGNATEKEREMVKKGGVRKSARVEAWASKAFDEWKAFRGYSTVESVADLSEKESIKELVNMLVDYFLELKMQNGDLYNPGT